ncbi:hypothetical protein DPMN_143865 [Dreissena polymorpha]|uniref:Uncharacterized protein n=1 Tax=Dreissena polymorpha TaxID=45954 RepID=A0A9D4JNM4_DREPO|nr:hypothetical protein DPMN_143865 [Dreissena polymorpha]
MDSQCVLLICRPLMLMPHVKHITHHHLFFKHNQFTMGRRKQSLMHETAITVNPCVKKTVI